MHQRFFIFHQGSLGDFILTAQALRRISTKPQCDFCCQGQLGRLAVYLRIAAQTFPVERASFATLFSESVDTEIAKTLSSYDRTILFSFSSQLETTLNSIAKHPVHRIPPRPPVHLQMHVTDFLSNHLKDFLPIDDRRCSSFPASPMEQQRSPSSVAFLHPGSGSPSKNWPLKKFFELATLLRAENLTVKWLLGPAEHYLRTSLQELRIPDDSIHVVSDLLAVVRLLHHARVFVGNDSGLSHLSAFIGIPTVAIFGPTNPIQWRPLGPAVAVVHPSLECDACSNRLPEKLGKPPGSLTSIKPVTVLEAIQSLSF